MSFSGRTAWQRSVRGIARALSCLVLAFAILTGLFQANTRYFYCESMGLHRVDPCVAAAHRDELPPASDDVSRTPFTCCATGVLGEMPASTALEGVRVESAKLVAVVGLPRPADAQALVSSLVPTPARRTHRLRIPPRPARELRAQSMVFLT